MDDATALSERIALRELSCVELMRDTLERIGRVNPALNAIVSLRDGEELLAEAAERDAELARGERRGWMHGLPHAVKDLEETAGIVTTSGSPLFADFVPETDSELVRRIRAAGRDRDRQDQRARVRLRLADLQRRSSGRRATPTTDARTAGGSSGGAAAALAAGLVPVADGSDYMGSLRNPAAFCNVYGFRPSLGRVGSPPAESRLRGADRHRRPDGPQPARPRRAAGDARRPARPSCRSRSTRTRRRSPRRSSRPTPRGSGSAGSATSAATCRSSPGSSSSARRRWRALGAEVVPVAPGFDPAEAWEAAVDHPPLRRHVAARAPQERLKPELRWEAEGARAVTGPALHAAQRTRTRVAAALRALLRDHDALALPSAQVFPFDVGHALAARDRRPRDADLPPLDGGRRPRLAGRPAGRRRARRGSARAGCRWACS